MIKKTLLTLFVFVLFVGSIEAQENTRLRVPNSDLKIRTNTQIRVDGFLETADVLPLPNETIIVSSSFNFTDSVKTNADGYFSTKFISPEISGEYSLQLQYGGSDVYNPATLNISLTVVEYRANVALMLGVFLLITVGIVSFAYWWENE